MVTTDVARAYDAVAPEYDRQLAGDAAMRRQLWRHYDRLFRPGMRVLDAGCGTGIDALHLAARGVHVTAIDVSPGMLALLEQKARAAGLGGRITPRLLDLAALSALPPASFDGVISAYAALNTLPDLTPFSAAAARLLRPDGHLIVHMLNRRSGWDRLARLRRSERAAREAPGERTVVIGGQPVRHFPWDADEAYGCFFARDFRLVRAYGVGVFSPPPERPLPAAVAIALALLERRAGAWRLWRHWGRFFVLELAVAGKRAGRNCQATGGPQTLPNL